MIGGHTNRLALRPTYPINPFHPLRIDARIAWTRTALKPISIYPFTNACNLPTAAAQIYQNVPFQVKRFQRDSTEVHQGAYAHTFCPTPISKHRLRPRDQPQILKRCLYSLLGFVQKKNAARISFTCNQQRDNKTRSIRTGGEGCLHRYLATLHNTPSRRTQAFYEFQEKFHIYSPLS